MNAVDTGYVTNEYPSSDPRSVRLPFLDAIDGAARVLDPIFAAKNGGAVLSGCFLKDFQPCDW